MEHKLVLGGEQYLPFARSRVKALRATGLTYASQQYEIDGVSIKVRIAGKDSFIRLEGSQLKILSGVIKEGNIVSVPAPTPLLPTARKDVLRSYRATENSWEVAMKKPATKPLGQFNDEEFLARQGSQYTTVVASQYSGLLAPAVQIILGRGAAVYYDYKWDRCHGIVRDTKGAPWLIEISQERGVLAMRLPKSKGSASSKNDAERKAVAMFGGVPTGGTFPVDAELIEALAGGSVLRLLMPEDLTPYTTKTPMAQWVGWSFSPLVPNAYNVVRDEQGGVVWTYLFKMAISINVDQPEVNATAQLTMEESGKIELLNDTVEEIRFVSRTGFNSYVPATPTAVRADATVPIHVRHVVGELDVLRLNTTNSMTSRSEITNPDTFTYPIYSGYMDVTNIYAGDHQRIIGKKLSSPGTNVSYFESYEVIWRRVLNSTNEEGGLSFERIEYVTKKFRDFPSSRPTRLMVSELARDALLSARVVPPMVVYTYEWHSVLYVNGVYDDGGGGYSQAEMLPPWVHPRTEGTYFRLPYGIDEGYLYYPVDWVEGGTVLTISLPNGESLSGTVDQYETSLETIMESRLNVSVFGETAHASLRHEYAHSLFGYMFDGHPANEHPGFNFIGYIK